MRTYLQVKYEERDEAKRLGARWCPGNRKWYVENHENLEIFMKWIPDHLKRPTGKLWVKYG